MQNAYIKNYGLWLGGALALNFLLGFTTVYVPYQHWLLIIIGTIVGSVMTHKELGKNIEFGKAVGPVLLFIGGFALLGLLYSIFRWGTVGLSYYLPSLVMDILTSMIIGLSILLAVGTWYMFEKAGKPGWAMIVPIYNLIVMCEIAKKPTWWVAMFLIPIANIIFLIMMLDGISKSFGKDSGFTVGLVFLRQIFFAILGYGDAVYDGVPKHDSVIDDI